MLDSVRCSSSGTSALHASMQNRSLDPLHPLEVGVYGSKGFALRFGRNACVGSCASAGPSPLRLPYPGQTPGHTAVFLRFKSIPNHFCAPFNRNYLIFLPGLRFELQLKPSPQNLARTKPSTTEPGNRKSHICEYEVQYIFRIVNLYLSY